MPRYIDADEVLETMRSNMDMQELYLPTHFIDLVIEDMPTADVQPVKHGRWSNQMLFDDGFGGARVGYICSACKKYVPFRGNFCGECGARMDGDSHDEP